MATNPQDRYRTPLVSKKLSDGRVVYRSAIPMTITPNTLKDIEIVATDALRMDTMAHNIYGSVQDWWTIASANGRVDGSLYFRPGAKIIIPAG